MTQIRQLAAVMFTDIVGYTALMGMDEDRTLKLLARSRQVQIPVIEKNNGKVVKELGDGILSCFNTVSEAVNSAIEIQQSCKNVAELHIRVGIHTGEVIIENNDVFGDAVNIASRIQSIGKPGSIYISEPVYRNISNKAGIRVTFHREVSLKNVKEAISIYQIETSSSDRESKLNSIKSDPYESIAVLPFLNLSNDPEQEYFCDGMAEEILNSLAHIENLKVAGRTSSFQFKGKNLDLREIGGKLGVESILEGSIRKSDNRLRISTNLLVFLMGFKYGVNNMIGILTIYLQSRMKLHLLSLKSLAPW